MGKPPVQPPEGGERNRSLVMMDTSEARGGSSEWPSAAKQSSSEGGLLLFEHSPLMLLWKRGYEHGLQGKVGKNKREEKERGKKTQKPKTKKTTNTLDTKKLYQAHLSDISQAEEQTIFVWFVLVLPVCFGFTQYKGVRYFA